MLASERHAIHDHVQAELRTGKAVMHPSIERSAARFALATNGIGLDHHAGEQVLVLMDLSTNGSLHPSIVVTERRVVGFGPFDVRYSQVARMERRGTLVPKLEVTTSGGKVEAIPGGPYLDALHRFLTRVSSAPPQDREPPPRPPCAPSDADPSGARAALEWLGRDDDRTAAWLAFVDAAHAGGMMPVETARDLVARISLHHRNLHFGRGMASARFTSPLAMNDLSNAMIALYGAPLSHTESPVRILDFDTRLRTESGAAAASSALGLASMALLGVGWVQTARQRVARMRFLVADTGPCASFRLQDTSGRELYVAEPGLVHEVDVKLLAREDAILARRVAFGWGASTAELLARSDDEVTARFAELLGGGDPTPRSDGVLRAAVEAVIGEGEVDLEDQGNFIVLYGTAADFGAVKERYVAHLRAEGWSMVDGSETDGSAVAKMLAEMGQHEAAALAAKKSSYGASFRRDGVVLALNADTLSKRDGLRVQLSRIS
jgi:hypothetical protein